MKSETCFRYSTNIPLSVYFSRSEAIDSACYVNQQYSRNFIEYQCERCKHWHLSPKRRQNETCFDCRGRDGKNKKRYQTQKIANQRVHILFQEKGKRLNIYRCPFSQGWHLTKK